MVKDVKTKKQVKKASNRQRRANGDKILYRLISTIISTALFFGLVFVFRLLERGSVNLFYFITLEFYSLLGTILLMMYATDIIGNLLGYGLVYLLYVVISKEGMVKSFWDINNGTDKMVERGLTNFFTRLFSAILLITGALFAIAQEWLPEVTIPSIILIYFALRIIGRALSIIIVKSML